MSADTIADRCACERPKPVEVQDETYEGLFAETPLIAVTWHYCARCGGAIAADHQPVRVGAEP